MAAWWSIETIFALPGIGRLTIDSLLNPDYTQLQGCILLIALVVVLINLLVESRPPRPWGPARVALLLRHILPNITAPLIVVMTVQLGTAILGEAALSFWGWASSRRQCPGGRC